ncbi:heme A synthase [Litorivivens sp.]|uniref:COX15/CtaA family protein n=1 Tax=Litorivivens sp. TaxID=2020868 RepID=UPI00356514F8
MNQSKPGYRLTLLACALAVLVVGLGAFTRLVDAGLGCPDWPTCYGHVLWPASDDEIAAANAHPDFVDTPVESHKTWPEQVHRLFASSLGLLGIIIFALSLKHRPEEQPWKGTVALLAVLFLGTVARIVYGDGLDPYLWKMVAAYFGWLAWLAIKTGTSSGQPVKLPAFIAGFLILQGLFGMWTVTLKLWPQVVTAHLLGGFTVFALLWLLALRLRNSHWQIPAAQFGAVKALKPFALIALFVVVAQVALGGWTTSNYAAVACPDLPTCQNEWLPEMNFAAGFDVFQHIGPNYLGGTMDNAARVAIHFSHRIGAIVTTIVLLMLAWRLRRSGLVPLQTMSLVVVAALALQVALGLGNILLKFPLWVTVSHNLGGALLLLTLVTLNYGLRTAEPMEHAS